MVLPPGENIRKFTVVVSQVGLIYFPHTKYTVYCFSRGASVLLSILTSLRPIRKEIDFQESPLPPPGQFQTELRNL
jgi:hypothetical protein